MINIGTSIDSEAVGSKVDIPIHHTGLFATTGVGKTKLLYYMISQVPKQRVENPSGRGGYPDHFQVLIFDSKVTGEEFRYIGEEIPFYIEQAVDADVIISLCESVTDRRGNYQWARAGFMRVCEGARNFDDVQRNLAAKLADKKHIHGKTADMYYEVSKDFGKLMEMIGAFKFSDEPLIDDAHAIFRMPIARLPNLALQGLVIRSTLQWVLKHRNNIVVLMDEATNFVHQKYYNPAKHAIQLLDSQGRSKGIFGWYSSQNLTGFDKSNMKNLYYWLLGREKERNERDDVYDTISEKIVTKTQIGTLPNRTFLVETPEGTKLAVVPFVDERKLFDIESKVKKEKLLEEKMKEKEAEWTKKEDDYKGVISTLEEERKKLRDEVDQMTRTIKEMQQQINLMSTQNTLAVPKHDPLTIQLRPTDDKHGDKTTRVRDAEIELTADEIAVDVKHRKVPVELDTSSNIGKIVYGLTLLRDETEHYPSSQKDIINRLAEELIVLSPGECSKRMSDAVSRGLVIKDGAVYRLPLYGSIRARKVSE